MSLHWPLWVLLFSLVCVVPPTAQSHKRLVLVVDCSGSMGEDDFALAMRNVRMITQQPTDDMQLVVYAFATNWARYPADGCVQLPNADELAKVDRWLHGVVVGTDTNVVPVLRAALKEPGPRTVMLVTDGGFYATGQGDAEVIAVCAGEPVRVIGVGSKVRDGLRLLAANGGGYWHEGAK